MKIIIDVIRKVVLWIWQNRKWLIPTIISGVKTIRDWFKKKPKEKKEPLKNKL